jgi:hypothetical protein
MLIGQRFNDEFTLDISNRAPDKLSDGFDLVRRQFK